MNKKFYLFILATMIAVNVFGYEKQTWNYETGAKLSTGSSGVHALDIYYPETGDAPYPVLIWLGMGIGQGGSSKEADYNYASVLIDTVLHRGYAVVVPNCNWKGKDDQPLPLHDCKAVVRFLRNNGEGMSEYPQNIDTSFIAVGGWSTGGLIATLMGMQKWSKYGEWYEGTVGNFLAKSSLVDAVASWSGFYVAPEDLASYAFVLNNIRGCNDSQYCGSTFLLRTFLSYAKDPTPEVVFHGSQDGVSKQAEANLLYTWLQEKIGDDNSEYYLINGQGHGLITLSSKYYYYGYMVNFFDRIRAKKAQAQAIDQITNGKCQMTNKVIKDGRLLILRGDKTYTLQGQEIK